MKAGNRKERFLRGGSMQYKKVLVRKGRIPGRKLFMHKGMELMLNYKEQGIVEEVVT